MTDKEICYQIYTDAFGADDFSVLLFETCYKYCRFFKIDDKIVSIMFLLPCEIVCKDIVYPANYVFAVTTAKPFRGKGYMSDFLNTVSEERVCFLKPVNDTLIDFYKKNKYKPFRAKKSREGDLYVKPCPDFLKLSKNITDFNDQTFTAMYRFKNELELDGLSFAYTME